MMFARALRERVRVGEVTTSVRIWQTPRVKVGGRYALLDGHIEVTRLQEVDLADVTEEIARVSGFESLAALMKTARHGRGERVFIVDFVFVPPLREGEPSGSGG